MCDEINVVIAPSVGGSTKTTALFSKKKRLSNYNPVDFNLIKAKVMDGGTLWVKYKVNH